MKQLQIMLVLLCFAATLFAQYEYEASEAFPFGQPNPEAPQQIKDWHLLIGACNCKSTTRNPDGSWQDTINTRWRWKYIMNGWAVQDEVLSEDGRHAGSIRQYDEKQDKWLVHYYTTIATPKALPAWKGEKKEDKITLYRPQKAPNGMDGFYRITFYGMTEKGFQWVGEWVSPDESIVYPTFRISCVKE